MNFAHLHDALKDKNFLQLPNWDSYICPMVYPFMIKSDRNLRKELIDNKVFVAKYWPNVQKNANYELEYEFATKVIPLPCDQRYGEECMRKIIEIINLF